MEVLALASGTFSFPGTFSVDMSAPPRGHVGASPLSLTQKMGTIIYLGYFVILWLSVWKCSDQFWFNKIMFLLCEGPKPNMSMISENT